VQIYLYDHIAAANERQIFIADKAGGFRFLAGRIFGAVDKTEKITLIEIGEAVDFADRSHRIDQSGADQARRLEAQIHALGPDVEQEVASRRRGMS
jgi:hypothetical protein